jgi:rubrerythrin
MPVQDRPNPASAEGDSAILKLANDPSSRSRFLKQVGGAGAAGAFAIFLAACGGTDEKTTAASTTAAMKSTDNASDLAIVNYALTLEYLEAQFYKDVVASGVLKGSEQDIAKMFGEQEAQHVVALKGTADKLGGAVSAPKAKFPIENRAQVLKLADTVENLGAAAYLGQAGNIKSPEVLAAALSIHSVEARHASALNVLLGKKPSPDGAFAVPADMKTVLAAVKPFIVTAGSSNGDSMGGSN